MSQLDDILARSRSPGAFVERSRFTLARDKAVEKMRQYALRDPRRYILELVQSAVFSGARFMAIDVSDEWICVAWVGGSGFKAVELENLLDFLLSRRHGSGNQHVVQLAIAVNALLQRTPKVIRIESGDGTPEGTVRIEIDSEGQGVRGTPEEGLAGTYITAQFDRTWFERFVNTDLPDEHALVETHCRYCSVPILLNGRAPFGWRGGRPRLEGANFDDGTRWGSIYSSHATDSRFRIVIAGVVVATLDLPELGSRRNPETDEMEVLLRGVICDDTLRRTADHSDIVRDRSFYEMLHALQPQCNEYLGQRIRDYVPPVLDPLPDVVSEETPEQIPRAEPEPLSEMVPQLGLRPPVPVSAIGADAADEPAFWVRPRDVDRLTEAASVARLPYPVYVLTPGQVRTLEERFPDQSVLPLGRPADVDFVVRALARSAVRPAIETHFEHDGLQGSLRIRATLSGPRVRWDSEIATDQVPLVIAVAGVPVFAASISGVSIPRLDVVWDLAPSCEGSPALSPAGHLIDPLQRAVQREVWRLFAQLATPQADADSEAARRDIVAGALAVVAQPHFVRTDGETRLLAHLPADTADVEDVLRSTPLANTAEGTLSFDDFIALKGTADTVRVQSDADLARLEPLEARFGYGNLTHPSLDVTTLQVVAEPDPNHPEQSRWRLAGRFEQVLLATDTWEGEACLATVWVGRCLKVSEDMDGMDAVDLGLAGVGAAKSQQAAVPVDLREGLDLLFETMAALQRKEVVPGLSDIAVDDRTWAMIRIATASLVDSDPEWRNIPLFKVGEEHWSLGRIRDRQDFGVVPAGGVAATSPHVVALTLDEVRAIERVRDVPVPLRFDDPPSVWTEADLGEWLLRVPIRYGSVRGWLGLRYPFDGTGGVLFRGEDGMSATAHTRRDVPSHGMVWSSDRNDTALTIPEHMLDLSNRKLYQALGHRLERGRWQGERQAAADAYAVAWVLEELERTGDVRSVIGDALAGAASVRDADGEIWGLLEDWLVTPPSERPALQHGRPVAPADSRRALPAMNLGLAPWMSELVRSITGETNLMVTVSRVPLTNPATLMPNKKLIFVRQAGMSWRRCHIQVRNDVMRWMTEPDTRLEARWMLTMTVIREWLPQLVRSSLVAPDFQMLQQEMLSRLMAASLD